MLSGLLATALLAPAQPPVPAPAPPTQVAPAATPAAAPPPSIDPAVGLPCPDPDGGFSFATTHPGPPWTFWGRVDYRLYWLRPAPSPGVLATIGGRPFGDRETEFGRSNGIGFDVGGWWNERHTAGLYGSGLLVEQKSRGDSATGPERIVRPLTDALIAGPVAFVVSDPAAGVTGALSTAQGIRLSGFDVGGVVSLARDCDWSADYLVGFRYLDLDEYLAVTQRTSLPAGFLRQLAGQPLDPTAGADLTITDRFRTRNQFYGGQVGLRGEYRAGLAFVNLTAKVGIGNVHQRVDIDGTTAVAGRPAVPGGLLATVGGNMGGFTTNRFAVLTEVGVAGGYQFAPWGRAKLGYDLLYLNDTARPGLQVDPVINTRFVPSSANFAGRAGLRSPLPTGRTDDFFAHGLRFGLELMY